MHTNRLEFNMVRLQHNQGHGHARRIGLNTCSYELVALMDADDISVPCRFEKQLKCFVENKEISVVGGLIEEFIDRTDYVVGIRTVPTEDKDIKTYIKKRCPFNQMTVMLKKSDVMSAGGYIDWYYEEDYYLWIRMYLKEMKFKNIAENLVFVRVGEEMYKRRGGWKYFKSETKLQLYMLKHRMFGLGRFIYNVGIRFAAQVVLPNQLRGYAYKLTRNKAHGSSNGVVQEIHSQFAGKTPDIPFSVSMCVYKNDNPEHFDQALMSVIHQTVQPTEIVLVVDGPIPESIESVIEKYKTMLVLPSTYIHRDYCKEA